MNTLDIQYQNLISNALSGWHEKKSGEPCRTGIYAYKTFGGQIIHDMVDGFPWVTLKPLPKKHLLHEFIWIFALGGRNIQYLVQNGVKYWSDWPYKQYCQAAETSRVCEPLTLEEFNSKIAENDTFADCWGDLGPVYGHQFRNYGAMHTTHPMTFGKLAAGTAILTRDGHDQFKECLLKMRSKPLDRRIMMTNWAPSEISEMLLPPCHGNIIQWDIADGHLHLQMYQRSADTVLGVPVDIALYGYLLVATAAFAGLKPGKLILTFGNTHVYENHLEAANELLVREPLPLTQEVRWEHNQYPQHIDSFLEFLEDPESFVHIGTQSHHPKLKSPTPVAV